MGINEIKYENKSTKKVDSIFNRYNQFNNQVSFSSIKIPEIKDGFIKKKTAQNDGKFSFLEFGKNICKGIGGFFTGIYKSVADKPIMTAGILLLTAALASTPPGLAFLAGGGAVIAITDVVLTSIKSANLIVDKKWDELEKQGKKFGNIIPNAAISALGAIRAAKMLSVASNTIDKPVKTLTAIRKSLAINGEASWAIMKNAVLAPYRAGKSFLSSPKNFLKEIKHIHKFFTEGFAKDYMKGIRRLNKNIFELDEKKYLIRALKKAPDRTKFMDWKFRGLRNIKNIPTLAGQAGKK